MVKPWHSPKVAGMVKSLTENQITDTDMRINAELVLKLRNSKFWSQDELAVASGLNLRTVQRIENDGVASLQSKKALAAAFDIEVGDLDYKERTKIMKYEYKVLKFDVKRFITTKVDSDDMEDQLNELGVEGWELISISEILKDMGVTVMLVATMRRSIVEEG
jgi:transcriptional regulator with XRE-family HTH domain